VQVLGEGGIGYLQNILDVAVSCGFDQTNGASYALEADTGYVCAWGNNQYGQLGQGDADDSAHPTPVKVLSGWQDGDPDSTTPLEDIVAISAGCYHVLALDNEKKVWAWGKGASGQLGYGGTAPKYEPVQVEKLVDGQPSPLTNIVYIDAGFNHSTAIDEDGNFWVWGENGLGQLGLGQGDTTDRYYATPMPSD